MLDQGELNERLLCAVRKGNTAQARRLIRRGADIETGDDEEDRPALYWAVRRGDVSMVRLLLKHRPRLDVATGWEDHTLLITALQQGNLPIVKLLTRASTSLLNRPDARGRTPAHVAVQYQAHEILEYLLSVDADCSTADRDRFTPIALAGMTGDTRSLAILLTKLPIDYWDNEQGDERSWSVWNSGGRTALHAAAENGQTEMVRELLGRGAYVRASDNAGWTPLHYACQWNYADAGKELISAGAQPWARTRSGLSPLAASAITCATDAMKLVMDSLNAEFDPERHQARLRDEIDEALRETVRRTRLHLIQDSDRVPQRPRQDRPRHRPHREPPQGRQTFRVRHRRGRLHLSAQPGSHRRGGPARRLLRRSHQP